MQSNNRETVQHRNSRYKPRLIILSYIVDLASAPESIGDRLELVLSIFDGSRSSYLSVVCEARQLKRHAISFF